MIRPVNKLLKSSNSTLSAICGTDADGAYESRSMLSLESNQNMESKTENVETKLAFLL